MNIFSKRKQEKKNKQDKVLIVLFFVLLLIIIINIFLYISSIKQKKSILNNEENQPSNIIDNFVPKKQINLSKTEEELNQKINLILDDCEIRNQQKISGSIEKIEGRYMYILTPGDKNSKKIKLRNNTVYIEISVSELLPPKEITYYDLSAGVSIFLVYALLENEYGTQEPTALYIKKIILE